MPHVHQPPTTDAPATDAPTNRTPAKGGTAKGGTAQGAPAKGGTALLAAVFIPLLLLAALAAALNRPGPPPAAHAVLAAYLTARRDLPDAPTLQSVTRSPRPGAFTAAMSRASYGPNYIFIATHSLTGIPAAAAGRPAPYPPADLWCVTLAGAHTAPVTLLLAGHADLHSAEWQLHLPAADPALLCPPR